MKAIDKRINETVISFLHSWTIEICGEIPVYFVDDLAKALFAASMQRMIKGYYVMGCKHNRRQNKAKNSKRFNRRSDEK